jgi:hypothetical protein
MHPNATAAMPLQEWDIIITTARKVDNRVVDVEGNESWRGLKIHAVPLIRYMGNGTEGLQELREAIEVETEGLLIPPQVRQLAYPSAVTEMRQNGGIATSTVVFIVFGSRVAHSFIKKCIIEVWMWY